MRIFAAVTLGLLVVAPPAQASGVDGALAAVYQDLSLGTPTPQNIVICHGFNCKYRTQIGLAAADWQQLSRIMADGRRSPEAERAAVATAVAWLQRRVAPETGTAKAVARAGPSLSGERSQFDCIDASRNTTTTLVVLDQLKLLRHHEVEPPEARGFFLDGRWPHATAVLRERESGRDWAVDSWVRNNGERPVVMPLEKWFAGG
jgi:hypothetical protein